MELEPFFRGKRHKPLRASCFFRKTIIIYYFSNRLGGMAAKEAKPTMKKHSVLPLLALAGGGAGLILHRWELSLAWDEAGGVYGSGQPATAVLLVLVLALLAAFFLLGRGGARPEDWRDSVRCPLTGYMAVMTAAALLLLASAGLGAASVMEKLARWRMDPECNLLPLMDGLCSLVCLPTALSVLKVGQGGYRGTLTPEDRWMITMPAYTAAFWAISVYQANAVSPYFKLYSWEMLSAICLLLALYCAAAGAYGGRMAALFPQLALAGVVLNLTAMGSGSLDRVELLRRTALMLTVLGMSYPALRARFGPEWTQEELARSQKREDEEPAPEENTEE